MRRRTQSLAERANPAKPRSSNLQIEIALTDLALKIFVAAIAILGWPQTSDRSTGYPATGALEIVLLRDPDESPPGT